MNHIDLGRWGEERAIEYLVEKGYAIRNKNFRIRHGEIDIVAYKDGLLVFIEVKTRRTRNYGLPCEAVDWRKRQKIINVASLYQSIYHLDFKNIRFDVIEVYATKEKTWEQNYSIRHLEGAF